MGHATRSRKRVWLAAVTAIATVGLGAVGASAYAGETTTSGTTTKAAAVTAAVAAPPAGFTLTWSDDFTGASGTGVDSNFKYDTGPGSSFGTGEIETMTNSTANVFNDGGGHLVLK